MDNQLNNKAQHSQQATAIRQTPVLSDLARSPLAHRAQDLVAADIDGKFRLAMREVPFTTQIGLRVTPGSAAAGALEAVLGVSLPTQVGQVSGTPEQVAVLWLGPDEFLAIAPAESQLYVPLFEALGEEPGQVVELSANRTVVELRGNQVGLILRTGTDVDTHPREFPAPRAVTTVFAQAPVLLYKVDDERWWLLPRASFAEHIANWVLDAMQEYRVLTPES